MKNIFTYINLLLLIFVFVFFFYKKENFVYVDSTKVFENFKMTKESFNEFNKVIEAKKRYLDSLENYFESYEIELKSKSKISVEDEKRYYLLQKELENKREQYDNESKIILNESRNKISARINEYSILFGKSKNLRFMFGVRGEGNIIYAEEGTDVTNELIDFINEKYSGKHN